MLLVWMSYHLSQWTKKPILWGMPISISFEPTTSCNLRCPECPSGLRSFTRPTGMLQNAFFSNVIDQLKPTLTYLTFYFQGEPYLNPNFLDMAAEAEAKGIITATSTNAHYLDDNTAKRTVESGLSRLIISVDGTDQMSYEQYRVGGDLSKVIEGTKNIIKWKKKLKSKTPFVEFQFIVFRQNEHQIQGVKKMGAALGVDLVAIKTAQVYDFEHGSELIPTIDRYSRYEKVDESKYVIKNKLLNQCWKMWHSCVITWDGKTVPCCFDKDASHTLGHLQNESFQSIWHGAEYNKFRKAILNGRDQIDICKNCTEGLKIFEN